MKSLELYKQLVPFLGEVLGKNSKIVLFDLSQKKEQVIAIANGTLEGQGIGAPLTDLARSIIKKESWKNQDYMTNFLGRTQDGQLLRSSNLFIKENGKLVGLLCINSNIEEYQRISRDVLRLSGLPEDFFLNLNRASALHSLGFSHGSRLRLHNLYADIVFHPWTSYLLMSETFTQPCTPLPTTWYW